MKHPNLLSIICALLVLIGASFLCINQSHSDQSDPARKKIVFLTGDDWNHASGTHEFFAGGLLLKQSLENSELKDQIEISVVNNWPEDESVFADADVIVHYYKGNKAHFLNQNHPFITKLAGQGASQMFMHYAVDPDTSVDAILKKLTGGVYKDKFSTNPHWPLVANLEKHPINQGLENYKLLDEWYFNIDFEGEAKTGYEAPNEIGQVYSVMHGNNADLKGAKRLKAAYKRELSASELTVFWAKQSASGSRGVGLTGGHYHKNWANDSFRKQVLNAIAWCADLPIPEAGVSSPEIDEKLINQNLDPKKKGGLKKISI